MTTKAGERDDSEVSDVTIRDVVSDLAGALSELRGTIAPMPRFKRFEQTLNAYIDQRIEAATGARP